jgi:hypothetical protein
MFESMTASAGLSMLGEIQLALVSEKADLKPEDLLGKPMTVSVALPDDKQRHFHGYVTRFAIGAHRGRFVALRCRTAAAARALVLQPLTPPGHGLQFNPFRSGASKQPARGRCIGEL